MHEPAESPSSPQRRRAARLLALAAALGALPLASVRAMAAVAEISAAQRRCFTALCDTLVPADPLTPAASTLGVHEVLLEDIASVADARRLLAVACAWLDERAAGEFAARAPTAREQIVQAMAGLPWNSPPGRFFLLARNSVMAEYYARPESWRGLALDRPPQPIGFKDALR